MTNLKFAPSIELFEHGRHRGRMEGGARCALAGATGRKLNAHASMLTRPSPITGLFIAGIPIVGMPTHGDIPSHD
jgi:hypothetical protein